MQQVMMLALKWRACRLPHQSFSRLLGGLERHKVKTDKDKKKAAV